MEFEIKDLDRVLETLDKFHDTLFSIQECFETYGLNFNLFFERITKSLETIAQEMVVENETL